MNISVRIFELTRVFAYASRLQILAIQVADGLGDTAKLAALNLSLPPGMIMAVTCHPTIRDLLGAIPDADWQAETAHLSIPDDTFTAVLKARWPLMDASVQLVQPYQPDIPLPGSAAGTG